MAGKLTYVGAGNALDGTLGRATQAGRTVYLVLCTAAPTQASTIASLTEYGAGGYSRQAITMGTPAGTPRVSANTNALTFGAYTGTSPGTTIGWWAIVSAASGTSGDCIAYGDVTSTRTPGTGDTTTVAAGAITVQLD